jgi:hypothetical protein
MKNNVSRREQIFITEITADLVAELFARNIADTYKAKSVYVRPIDTSVETYLIRSRNF